MALQGNSTRKNFSIHKVGIACCCYVHATGMRLVAIEIIIRVQLSHAERLVVGMAFKTCDRRQWANSCALVLLLASMAWQSQHVSQFHKQTL